MYIFSVLVYIHNNVYMANAHFIQLLVLIQAATHTFLWDKNNYGVLKAGVSAHNIMCM